MVRSGCHVGGYVFTCKEWAGGEGEIELVLKNHTGREKLKR